MAQAVLGVLLALRPQTLQWGEASPPEYLECLLSAQQARGWRFRGTPFESSSQVFSVTWDSCAVPPRAPVSAVPRGEPAAVCHWRCCCPGLCPSAGRWQRRPGGTGPSGVEVWGDMRSTRVVASVWLQQPRVQR